LGCSVRERSAASASDSRSAEATQVADVVPPSFRQDLTREIDLIEEIARIHGYDRIPENAMVPMVASMRRPEDGVLDAVRRIALGAGCDEALNPSLIGKSPIDRISPWTQEPALSTAVPLLEGASVLRRSLIPSLIAARLHNQSQSNRDVRLFEIAKVYLPHGSGLPSEPRHLGVIAECDPRLVRGIFEEILHRVWGDRDNELAMAHDAIDWDFLEPGTGMAWSLSGHMLCWSGTLSRSLAQSVKLEGACALGELNLDALMQRARLVPRLRDVHPYPSIQRDLNLIVDESVAWKNLRDVIAVAAGPLCVEILFREIYRDVKRDGAGKKRMLLSLQLQSPTETLRSEQADAVIAAVLSACQSKLGAQLLS
jgi:phenylalanyl-tRNA synthetase beta chain